MLNFKQTVHFLLASAILALPEDFCNKGFEIKNSEELKAVEGCGYIYGSLTVTSEFEGNIDLPNLDQVMYDIEITGDKILEINLAKLKKLDNLTITNASNLKILNIPNIKEIKYLNLKNIGEVESLDFKKLETASDIVIEGSKANAITGFKIKNLNTLKLASLSQIENIEFPDLETVDDTLEIENIVKLSKLSFEKLKQVENLNVGDLATITLVSFPSLDRIKSNAFFRGIPNATIYMPSLTSVSRELVFISVNKIDAPRLNQLDGLTIKNVFSDSIALGELKEVETSCHINNNNNLESIDFPKLSGTSSLFFKVHENLKLSKLSIPNLSSVDTLDIDLPELTEFQYSKSLKGTKFVINSKKDCKELINLHFHDHKCRNPPVASVTVPAVVPSITPPVSSDNILKDMITSTSSTNNTDIKEQQKQDFVDSSKINIIDFEINNTSSSGGVSGMFNSCGLFLVVMNLFVLAMQ